MNTFYGDFSTKKEEGVYLGEKESMVFALNPPMSLYVNTDNPNRRMMVVCHKEDTTSTYFYKRTQFW